VGRGRHTAVVTGGNSPGTLEAQPHHLSGTTSVASPQWHHLSGITSVASPVASPVAQWHHLSGITGGITGGPVASPQRHRRWPSGIASVASPQWHRRWPWHAGPRVRQWPGPRVHWHHQSPSGPHVRRGNATMPLRRGVTVRPGCTGPRLACDLGPALCTRVSVRIL
jgi:hypothetical protein